MQSLCAVITTVRDDDFFLRKWVEYYGGFFGKEALYIINHGNQDAVREIAAGCNLFPIPDTGRKSFNPRRWRTQNALLTALRQWYRYVIVCDVDEFVVVDPNTGHDLGGWIAAAPDRKVFTALGLELTHLPSREPRPIEEGFLGPRRHAQLNAWYSKPCIIGRPARLSRGGHYADFDKLTAPPELYLFHMKYCDYDLYVDTLNRRNEMVQSMGVKDLSETTTNRQWFALDRDDAAEFAAFEARPVDESWDFSQVRANMAKSWEKRGENLYHFKREKREALFHLPERFGAVL